MPRARAAARVRLHTPVTPIEWSDAIDEVLGGDLTAGLAYATPAGGAVVTAVAPIGLRDRAAGTVGFTTSFGFGKKLERIRRDPRVALAYHAREHGHAAGASLYVLAQGRASVRPHTRAELEAIEPNVVRVMGQPRRGPFWDRWLAAYYADRVVVDVALERIVAWPALDCSGAPDVLGTPLPGEPASPQAPPANGTGPRVPAERAAQRLAGLPHRLVAWIGADGFPLVLPYDVAAASPQGVEIDVAGSGLAPGGRRAGLLAHDYRPRLIGLKARQHTGWIEQPDVAQPTRAVYAPHTESGFLAPPNKTLLLLANGFIARRGLRKARKAARAGAP
jgi:hypothetical protein